MILDRALTEIHGVSTVPPNEEVNRNSARFPADFMFVLIRQGLINLISQIARSSSGCGGVRKPPRTYVEVRRPPSIRDELAKRPDKIERKLLRHDTSLQELRREIKALRQDAGRPRHRQARGPHRIRLADGS